jgi:hypothetical protein
VRAGDCRCGACVRCLEVIERFEPEAPPTCSCGCELITGTERSARQCAGCAWDSVMARIDWRGEDAA